jgi:hypothetical protein
LSDTVAIVSIVVTGVASPAIVAIAAHWQARASYSSAVTKERREVLDYAAERLAQLRRASLHCIALWSRGVSDTTDEVRDQLRQRSIANDGMLAAQGRISIRFGPASRVAVTYGEAIETMREFTTALDAYRRGESFDSRESRVDAVTLESRMKITEFLAAANKAIED